MTNIKSLGDYLDKDDRTQFSYAGGHNSAIGIDGGSHVVNLYADGFIVDDGPFRPLSDPVNAKFISDVKNGIAPPEFQDGDRDVNVHLIDNKNKHYLPENDNSTSSFSSKHTISNTNSEWCTGETNTTLRIKLYNGDVVNLRISEDATLGDLKQFISQCGSGSCPVRLLYGYPPRPVNFEESKTLKEADILNCNVIQK